MRLVNPPRINAISSLVVRVAEERSSSWPFRVRIRSAMSNPDTANEKLILTDETGAF